MPDPEASTRPRAPESGVPTVLQVVPALEVGGAERATVDVAAALAAAGWRAIVASSGGRLVREVERAGARHVILPVDAKGPFAIRANVDRLADLMARESVDLVHARSRAPAWSARAAARRTGRPFVTTFHGVYGAGSPLKRLYSGIMAKGDRVIAVSEFVAGHARALYRADDARLRVVPRGIDMALFDPARVSAERIIALARRWALPDGVPVVMLPGRLSYWKGHAVLVEALARLGRRDVVGLLVGAAARDGGTRRRLERAVAARGLGGVVRLVEEWHDMPAAYMLADVVVSASTEPEAFGRVAVEAQAMGRPVVASDHGGARETVVPGETGWLTRPGDAGALAAALDHALGLGAAERMALARRARSWVAGRFDKATMCAATLAVYRELVAEPARAGVPAARRRAAP